ncbi:MAG: hypothetical protein H3C53_00405 [Trueperaceae bacterium]|nr:hypothetical protein [Trueperaceae bacterium]
MLFRRQRAPDLGSAHEALAKGQYDVAFAVLESAVKRGADRTHSGQAWLQLAAVYALYGDEGLENGQPALRNAVGADPKLASRPLYRALFWEFAAYRGAPLSDVKRGLREVPEQPGTDDRAPAFDPVASYHAAAALFTVDAAKSAARRLRALGPGVLPAYLEWRRWSLLGQCAEVLGEWEEAAGAFTFSVQQAPELEKGAERLSLAGALVELYRTEEALEHLAATPDDRLQEQERAVHRYLLGRAHLDLDNPNLALQYLREAALLDDEQGGPTYSVAFATAQALTAAGRSDEAVAAFAAALETVPAEHRAFTQHEAAYAYIECDRLSEAEALLGEVVTDPSYSHRGDALADLADVRLRRGELDAAGDLAREALELGATAPACITLGSVAFEYYRLEEAAAWYEQALSASQTGDPFWVAAQQMLADVYSQMGEQYTERVLLHARAALEHTEAGSDWYLPLKQYVEGARDRLGGFERVLN